MPENSPVVRRTFRFSVDVETTVTALPNEPDAINPEHAQFYQAIVQRLLAHPKSLDQLLRASAVDALKQAEMLLAAEYGWNKATDQQLLQPIIEELEPAAQMYFMEEIAVGVSIYYFDGYAATVKHAHMAVLDAKDA